MRPARCAPRHRLPGGGLRGPRARTGRQGRARGGAAMNVHTMSRRREDEAIPIAEAAGRDWDIAIVGAGHNGLTTAAYLARAGRRVLVLEARERIGGACRLERPFADRRFIVSPCAYVVGLLHSTVVQDLDLHRYGYTVRFIDPHLWCPFEDGTALALWDDTERNRVSVGELSPHDVDGYLRYE